MSKKWKWEAHRNLGDWVEITNENEKQFSIKKYDYKIHYVINLDCTMKNAVCGTKLSIFEVEKINLAFYDEKPFCKKCLKIAINRNLKSNPVEIRQDFE